MTSFLRQLFRDKSNAIMLLTSSLIIAICALAPALFVIIVLNKYLASGVTSTLISLGMGAILLLAFEFGFRQNRAGMIQQLNIRIFTPLLNAYAKKIKETQITGEQFKRLEVAGGTIKGATGSSITGWILDWPFVLAFLIVLLYINWTAALIAGIFMIIMMVLTAQRLNLSLQQDSTANLEIFLTGLMTVVIMSVGATQIIAGSLDVGLLIGSNILAARALQGANKYAKAKEAIEKRDRATAEIINFIKQ
jgi:ABC-type bacteriocin/lantibiotic exporter with double-glycine peptidase domain|tara:strand:- start:1411 stop:2160 length:750 start_codon:yes stop_codon:yes gene_type:complete